MNCTPLEIIRERVLRQKDFKQFQIITHHYRQIIAGDYSSLGVMGRQTSFADLQSENQSVNPGPNEVFHNRTEVLDYAQFRNNNLVKGVKTIGLQTMFRAPEAVFGSLEPKDAEIHNKYLQARLFGPAPIGCAAHAHASSAHWDALISGVGCVIQTGIPMRHSTGEFTVPAIQYADIARTWWDAMVPPSQSHWVCVEFKKRISWFEQYLGEGFAKKYFKTAGKHDPINLIYYFDREGPEGTFAILIRQGDNIDDDPLQHGPSLYSTEIQGYKIPKLPVHFLTYMDLPGGAAPVSIVGLGFRAQLDAWTGEAAIRQAMEYRAMMLFDEEAVKPEDRAKVLRGETAILGVKNDSGKSLKDIIAIVGGSPLDKLAIEVIRSAYDELEAQMGYSRYSSGQNVNAGSATETAAIVNGGQTTTSMIVQSNAKWYGEVISSFLAQAQKHDDAPVEIPYGETRLKFGATAERGPIGLYLQADADIEIKEESLQYQGTQQRRDKAVSRFQLLAPLPIVRQEKLVEDVLEADGVSDIKAYLKEQPPMMPQPMQQGDPAAVGAPGGNVGTLDQGLLPVEQNFGQIAG